MPRPALHTTPVREFIHRLKYEQRPDLAPPLGCYLAAALLRPEWDGLRDTFDTVVQCPHSHAEHLAERGYNQAEYSAGAQPPHPQAAAHQPAPP